MIITETLYNYNNPVKIICKLHGHNLGVTIDFILVFNSLIKYFKKDDNRHFRNNAN